jgi:hypothetical protein
MATCLGFPRFLGGPVMRRLIESVLRADTLDSDGEGLLKEVRT